MPIIYLAGYGGEFDYREYCKTTYGTDHHFIDPMQASSDVFNRMGFNHTIEEVIEHGLKMPYEVRLQVVKSDKEFIDRCDAVVAYIARLSFGTIMEIMYAFNKGIPVYVVNPGLNFSEDVWLSVHATMVFNDLEECFKHISKVLLND